MCSSTADPCPIVEDISDNEAKLLVEHFHWLSRKGDTRTFQRSTCFMALSRRQVSECMATMIVTHVQLYMATNIQACLTSVDSIEKLPNRQ